MKTTLHSFGWLLVASVSPFALFACGMRAGGQSGTDEQEQIGRTQPRMPLTAAPGVPLGHATEPDAAADVPTSTAEGDDDGASQPGPATLAEEPAQTSPTTDAAVSNAADVAASEPCNVDYSGALPDVGQAVYIAKDDVSSVCWVTADPGTLCFRGRMAEATEDFSNWGGGIGLVLSGTDASGVVTAFDAAAQGFTGVQFKLTGLQGYLVRASLNQVDDPSIAEPTHNFLQNAFVGGEFTQDATYSLYWGAFALPSWTQLDADGDGISNPEVAFDPTRLNSLQFFVAAQVGVAFDYELCVSDVRWLSSEAPATGPVPVAPTGPIPLD